MWLKHKSSAQLLCLCLWLLPALSSAQQYTSFTETLKQLTGEQKEQVWKSLIENEQIPFVYEDSVAFLFRGEAKSVSWMGDFNGWGFDKNFQASGTQLPGSDIWLLKASFPKDARLDYKIVIDNTDWILDPVNPHQQWSGVGGGSPNSALHMPLWRSDTITQVMPAIFRGRVINDLLISSKKLGYQVGYSIYLPSNFKTKDSEVYPILYVFDGYEYMHERMGNMITVLDNLIYLKEIKPVIVVFIDHREPVNRANNRRMQELSMNDRFVDFLADELVTKIEKQYPVTTDPTQRAVLGTSMGGLAAAYVAFAKPDLFGLAGIQSPAFLIRPEIYAYCDRPEKPVKIMLTTGLVHDAHEGTLKMKSVLDKNQCTYQYREVNQGHSWGNWRQLIDDILLYFFPTN